MEALHNFFAAFAIPLGFGASALAITFAIRFAHRFLPTRELEEETGIGVSLPDGWDRSWEEDYQNHIMRARIAGQNYTLPLLRREFYLTYKDNREELLADGADGP